MNKITPLRQAVDEATPPGRRFTLSDVYRAIAPAWTHLMPAAALRDKIGVMIANMAYEGGPLVRDGVGMYHRPLKPKANQVTRAQHRRQRYEKIFDDPRLSWDGYVSPSTMVRDGVVNSTTYGAIVLCELVRQGKIMRVKHGWYTRNIKKSDPVYNPLPPLPEGV